MSWVLNAAYLLAGIAYLPVLIYQMVVQRKNRRGWRERFGHLRLSPAANPRIWLHAVSLGEINCTPALVKALADRVPGCEIVVSATTDTGHARACRLYPPDRVFRYPLDLSWTVRRAMDRVRPSLIVLVEQEVWPNLIAHAVRRNVPVVVINGRLTERSARRLAWLGPITRRMFSRLTWVGAQDEPIADRFRRLGSAADRVGVTGSLKWDTAAVADGDDGAEAVAQAMGISRDRPLWVCGSTGPGEEGLILDAFEALSAGRDSAVSLAIIPRKPERFGEVADLIRRRGFACVRRSECPDGHRTSGAAPPRTVFLGDTVGELRRLYSLARVVLVGRSLVPMGGSDPMEVAALAKPIVVGPHMDNFSLPVDRFHAAEAIRVVRSATELAGVVEELASDPERAQELGRRARDVVLENQGATTRTVEVLVKLMN